MTKLSVRRQCKLIGVNRSGLYAKPKAPDKAAQALYGDSCDLSEDQSVQTKLSTGNCAIFAAKLPGSLSKSGVVD